MSFLPHPVSGGNSFAQSNAFGKSFECLTLAELLRSPPSEVFDAFCREQQPFYWLDWRTELDGHAYQVLLQEWGSVHGELSPSGVTCSWDLRLAAPGWTFLTETKCCKTSRFFVEESYNNRPSGIRNTPCPLWVFGTTNGNAFGLWLPMLQTITAHLPRSRAGDGKRSVGSWLDVSTAAAAACWSFTFNPSALWGLN